ncbi:GNAT family N-acetyltransferase [Fictibacillus nanhaiensis]|uniref:GNAT family N-acetyltransferase n=1 Tax=Fictibacillus nanhaiensis TaxID=742169 RepID=A0ABS2ZPR6_9BACL|nr:GNAT family N-acetyltransferase [Fictibacillus nanhaiensis]
MRIENEIVRLIPMKMEHVEGIYKAADDERIWKHMSVNLTDKNAVVLYVEDAVKRRQDETDEAFVIVHQETGEIIGATWFLDISVPHKRLEIGSTWIHPDYWRSNINTNCKYLLLQHCFEERSLQRVQIKTSHQNVRSQKAIERIGAKKEGILRNHLIQRDGSVRHTVLYSVVSEEWSTIKKHFEDNLLQNSRRIGS